MTPEEAIQVADEVLLAHAGSSLRDIHRMILRESLAGKGYESMEGYTAQHIKNEGKKLWDLLSEALGEKVSKTSFEGALEKRRKLGELIPKPPLLSIYNSQTWVGRKAIIYEYLPKLQGQARILWITGISGIGKTALGQCLASQAWEDDPSFQWLYLEILEGQSPEFVSIAPDLLAKLGEVDLEPQERNDPKRLMERLLRKLKASRYWFQVDSLERLLDTDQQTETVFADHYWIAFLQHCLTESDFVSRLVFTAQALPSSLAEWEDRYSNLWQLITLQGLLAKQQADQQPNEHLELFAKNGLRVDDINLNHLQRIGRIYEGHPLVLQVIAKEILALPFGGNVATYWERYGNEFEQVARELQAETVSPELYNQALLRRVRHRVEVSLKHLPTNALDLLCRSSVYRRPVPETFWLSLFEEYPSQQRQQVYQVLNERTLIEREGIYQNQFLIRQHNLVRSVAYDLLKANTQVWHQSERQAAHLWLNSYEPTPNAANLEIVRGYIEAFDHYYIIEDWEAASKIYTCQLTSYEQEFHLQLLTWGCYGKLLEISLRLVDKAVSKDRLTCLHEIGNSYGYLGNDKKAIEYYNQALHLSRKDGSSKSEGISLGNLSVSYYRTGQYEEAIECSQQNLSIVRKIGYRKGEIIALGTLGYIYITLGDYEQATKYQRQSLTIAQEIGDRQGESYALGNLGLVYYRQEQYEQAIEQQQQALIIAREIGDRMGQAEALGNLGIAYFSLEQYERAIDYQQQMLMIAQEIGDRMGEGSALANMGEAQFKKQQYSESLTNNQTALQIFREIGHREGEAETLINLAKVNQDLGKIEVAQRHCQQSLALATDLNIPLKEKCEALMEELKKDEGT